MFSRNSRVLPDTSNLDTQLTPPSAQRRVARQYETASPQFPWSRRKISVFSQLQYLSRNLIQRAALVVFSADCRRLSRDRYLSVASIRSQSTASRCIAGTLRRSPTRCNATRRQPRDGSGFSESGARSAPIAPAQSQDRRRHRAERLHSEMSRGVALYRNHRQECGARQSRKKTRY